MIEDWEKVFRAADKILEQPKAKRVDIEQWNPMEDEAMTCGCPVDYHLADCPLLRIPEPRDPYDQEYDEVFRVDPGEYDGD